ncbi:MAG: DUF4156 domain-containing protein [Treponemataceae bacterium]|nr:DUF4156 domain-containing protein [Treponemataceae bacterium]
MKKFRIILSLFIPLMLIGCASGTYLITGTQREAIGAESVVIYTEFPAQYETIGIVTASSDAGWTEQDSLNYAVAELKNQAAKIGANGVVIENMGETSSGGMIVSGIYVPVSAQNVSGKAIYVELEKNAENPQ